MARVGNGDPLDFRDQVEVRLHAGVRRLVVLAVDEQRRDGDLVDLAGDVVVLESAGNVELGWAVPVRRVMVTSQEQEADDGTANMT
jgi:hypothetical protein